MISGSRTDRATDFHNSMLKRAFVGSGAANGAAGEYALVQLWNPAASGYLLVCDTMIVNVEVGATLGVRWKDAALSILGKRGSKYIADAGLIGEPRQESSAAPAGTEIAQISIGIALVEHFKFREPFIIPEGYGLCVFQTAVDAPLRVVFEWIVI